MDGSRVETLPDPSTPTTPSGLSAIFGHDPTTRVSFTIPLHKEDGPPKYEVACHSFSFLVKLFQLLTSIVTAGLYSVGVKLVEHDITSQQLPFVVTSAFIIITAITILSYMLGQKMPEILIRMFNLLAALLFAVSGIVILNYWIQYYDYWQHKIEEELLAPWKNKMLLATAILCLINCLLYMLDFIFSIRRTLNIIGQ